MDKGFASIITGGVDSADSPVTVQSGNPVNIYGFTLANSSASDQTVTMSTGSGTPIATISIQGNKTKIFATPFYAEAGLQFAIPDDLSVIIFHSHEGA